MSEFNIRNHPLLSITTAVRLIEQPKDAKLQAPDFDEHGFPVMCGADDFYGSLTNNGRDKIVVMTFEPQQTGANREISDKTFFIKLTERFEPGDQLLLKQADAYLLCRADEREQFSAAAVFGIVTSTSVQPSNQKNHKNPAAENDQNEFDEFDQTRSPRENRRRSNFRDEFEEETRTDQRDDEAEYDYNQDFGA